MAIASTVQQYHRNLNSGNLNATTELFKLPVLTHSQDDTLLTKEELNEVMQSLMSNSNKNNLDVDNSNFSIYEQLWAGTDYIGVEYYVGDSNKDIYFKQNMVLEEISQYNFKIRTVNTAYFSDIEDIEPEVENDILAVDSQGNYDPMESIHDEETINPSPSPQAILPSNPGTGQGTIPVSPSVSPSPQAKSPYAKPGTGQRVTPQLPPSKPQTSTTYFLDADGDGFGDPNKYEKAGSSPGSNWVLNSSDKCPMRKGEGTTNGCPVPSFDQKRIEKYKGETFEVNPTIETVAGDKFSWKSDSKIKVMLPNVKSGTFIAVDYGLSLLVFNISNPNGYNESATIEVLSKISKKDLEDKLREDIINIGRYDRGNYVPPNEIEKSEKTRDLLISLFDRNGRISEKGKAFGNNIGAFIDAKMLTKGSYVNDVRVNSITYNQEGFIDHLDIELIKY